MPGLGSFLFNNLDLFDPMGGVSSGTINLWYDLGYATASTAGLLTVLPDQSGNSRDAVISGGTAPTYTAANTSFNSIATMNFAASDTKKVVTPDLGIKTGPFTVVTVVSTAASATNKYAVSFATANVYSDGYNIWETTNDESTLLAGGASGAATASVIVTVYNGASSRIYNSSVIPVYNTAGTQPDQTGLTATLGNYHTTNSAKSLAGSIAHVLVYNGALSQRDCEYLLYGFGAKAGVTIAYWTPASITSKLSLWLDPSDTSNRTLVSGHFSQLTDKSSGGLNATQTTPALRPGLGVASINDLDTFRCSTLRKEYFDIGNLSALTAAEIFIVRKSAYLMPPVGDSIWHLSSNVPSSVPYVPKADALIYDNFGSTALHSTATRLNSPPNVAHIYSVISTSTEWTNCQNGGLIYTTGTNTVGFATTGTLGSDGYNSSGADCDYGEIILCNQKLLASERAALLGYLSNKWGVTLFSPTDLANISWWVSADDVEIVIDDALTAQTDPVTLAFTGLFRPEVTERPTWAGTASTGTSASYTLVSNTPGYLNISGWWQGAFTSLPWLGTGSNGLSFRRDLITNGSNPTVGTGSGGYASALFTAASSNYIETEYQNNIFFTKAAGSLWILFYANTAPALDVTVYYNGQFLSDAANAETIFGFTTSGIHCSLYSGGYSTLDIACATGGWHLAQFKWNSTNLYARVDRGLWTSTPCGALSFLNPSAMTVGRSYAGVYYLDAQILDCATSTEAFTDSQFTDIVTYCEYRYGLNLAWTPAILSLTGWWSTDFSASPWVGTASGGTSGSHDLTAAFNVPTAGTAVNGHVPAAFDGINQRITGTTISTYISATAGGVAVLFYANTAAADAPITTAYASPGLFTGDGGGTFFAISFDAGGVKASFYDGPWEEIQIPTSTGAWHLAQVKWDGVHLKARVDSSDWYSIAATTIGDLSYSVIVGTDYGGIEFLDGDIAEIMTCNTTPTDNDFDNIKQYCMTKYGLTLSDATWTPALLSLTGWFRGPFYGDPWHGSASAGASFTTSATEATNPPIPGSGLNGYFPALFDGVNDELAISGATSDYIATAAGSCWLLLYANSAIADVPRDQPFFTAGLLCDMSGAGFNIGFTTAGFVAGYYDFNTWDSVAVACATGGWHLCQARWDGTKIEARVDSGSWSSVSRGVINVAGQLHLGVNYADTGFFDGNLMDVGITKSILTDVEFEKVRTYINTRYGLAL